MKVFVLGKYTSKYGMILYCIKVNGNPEEFVYDLDNCYVNTYYLKGAADIKINTIIDIQTIKGDNGLTYAFVV